MPTSFTDDQLLAAYKNAPQKIQDALSHQGPVIAFIGKLRTAYGLKDETVTEVIKLIRNLLLGLIDPQQFAAEMRTLDTGAQADVLIKEFTDTVYVPLRDQRTATVAASAPPPAEASEEPRELPINRLEPASAAPPAPPTPPPAPARPIPAPPRAPTPPVTPMPSTPSPVPKKPTAPIPPAAAVADTQTAPVAAIPPRSAPKAPLAPEVKSPAPAANVDPYREPIE